MIRIQNVTFQYKGSEQGGVRDISLSVHEGETILLCGSSGSGKTTVMRLINGLIPHYYKGELSGSVMVDGMDIGNTELYDLAGIVGTVFQNPRSQFFSVDTDGEIVFGPENIGLQPEEIRRRKDLVTEEMALSSLLNRSLFELSGGEKQKIACASVAALLPKIVLLDEPSSNLDWKAIGNLRRVIQRWKEQGKTILISEHRLWYVQDLVDRVLFIRNGQIEQEWSGTAFRAMDGAALQRMELRASTVEQNFSLTQHENRETNPTAGEICFKDFYFNYEKKQRLFHRKNTQNDPDGHLTLRVPDFCLRRGCVTGLIGSNGAGKTTLLRCICGLEKGCGGRIELNGQRYIGKKKLSLCYLVMQDVNHQLFTDSVEGEVLLSMDRQDSKAVSEILASLNLADYAGTHPMALSGGQKQRVAIASAMAAKAELLLFDEPTSGLDYVHMCSVAKLLRNLAEAGKTILVSTHDPELLSLCADDILHIEGGQITEHYDLNKDTIGKLGAFFTEQIG